MPPNARIHSMELQLLGIYDVLSKEEIRPFVDIKFHHECESLIISSNFSQYCTNC